MKSGDNVELNEIAIILIEFQKTWTEKSFFHKLIQQQYDSRNVYNNSLELLSVARKNGVTIIQAPMVLDKKDKENYKKIPLPPKLLGQFTANTWRAEYTDGIYAKTDIEVSGRCGFDACKGSDLQKILNNKKVKVLYFLGFTTDHCVADTMTTLILDGYECVFVSDCTAARNAKLQSKIENKYQSILSAKLISKLLTGISY